MGFPYQKKAECIADDLRTKIVGGAYAEGERLPTRTELKRVYHVTSDTLQRALNWLMEEGFVVSAGRRGTFVAEHPPHLTNYALLFPDRFLPGEPTNRFLNAMYREAQKISGARRIRICDGFSGRAGFLEYDALMEDVRQNRVAGLIFATAPFAAEGTPLMADDGVPRTAIMTNPQPHVSAVNMDHIGFLELVAEEIVKAKRTRVAVLLNARLAEARIDELRDVLAARGLAPDPTHIVGVSIEHPEWAWQVTSLLFNGKNRPDAFLVADDNLLEPATRALKDMGLRAPDDVLIMAHCNFPWPAKSHLPASRVGFSITEVLETCLHNIDIARQGGKPKSKTVLAPFLGNMDARG